MKSNPSSSKVCPSCGASAAVRIVYGLPDAPARQGIDDGQVEYGGCVIKDDSPQWRCKACDRAWGDWKSSA